MQPLRSDCSRGFLHNVRIWEFPLQLLSDGQDQIPHDLNWSSLSDGEFVLFSQVIEMKEKASHFENHFSDLSNSDRNRNLQTAKK